MRKPIDKAPKRPLPADAYEDTPIKCPNCRRIMPSGIDHYQGNRYNCPREE